MQGATKVGCNNLRAGCLLSLLCLLTSVRAVEFKILTLTANNVTAIECNTATGDDRGGIAVSNSMVFLTGDSNTARFNRADLTGGVGFAFPYDALTCNIHNGKVYTLANSPT